MKKKDLMVFIIIFLISIISTISFLQPHYSIDTVEFLRNGYNDYIHSKFLVDGRIFSVLLLKVTINLPMKYVLPITYVIGLMISCISVMYIRKLIIDYKKNKSNTNIIPTIIAYVIVFNFMYTDTLQFLEFPIIAASVLFYTIAAKLIIYNEKHYIVKSLLITLMAMFCYQGTMSVLIMTALVLSIIKYDKINKKLIVDMLKVGIILLVAVSVNYLFTMLMGGTSRIDFDIIENLKNTVINLYLLIFNGGCQYPEYFQLIFIVLICVWCIINKSGFINAVIIYIISIIINSIILVISINKPFIAQYGRMFFSIGAVVGYILMYLWCTDEKTYKSKFIKTLIIVYFITIIITYIQYTYFYMKGQKIDEYITKSIDNIISEYEKTTGVKVTKFARKIDENYEIWNTDNFLEKSYKGVNYYTIRNGRRTIESFSSTIFKIYANRDIEQIYVDDKFIDKLFEDKELNGFSKERFVFIDDTIYFKM